MNRINPEVFDAHRRLAETLRKAAIRRWKPLSWILSACHALQVRIARYATSRRPHH